MLARADLADVVDSDLVPFIGAGVSGAVRLQSQRLAFPNWSDLILLAATKLGSREKAECERLAGNGELVEAARVITENLSRPAWHRLLRKTFDPSYSEIDETSLWVHKLIWRCSNGLVITTNYDRTLAWTAPDQVKGDLRIIGLDQPLAISSLAGSNRTRPILWHLHGRIEFPGTLVISPSGYEKLYGLDDDVSVNHHFAQAIFCLRHIIATRSLFFVGFSLADASVVGELQNIFKLFDDSENSHFVVAHMSQVATIEARVAAAGLSNVEIVEIRDYTTSMKAVLESIAIGIESRVQLSRPRVAGPPLRVLRRRCRTVTVGTEKFRREIMPCIAENRQSDAPARLINVLTNSTVEIERRIVAAALYEAQGDFDRMLEVSVPAAFEGEDWCNLALFHAIALEKLGRVEESIALDGQIARESGSAEMAVSARFNAMVGRSKVSDPSADFTPWVIARDTVVCGVEKLWIKAFTMQLIVCAANNSRFAFEGSLDDALAEEVALASTGFGKTLLSWSAYSGHKLNAIESAEVWRVAGQASLTARLAMLDNLRAFTSDEPLAEAIDRVLDGSGGAYSPVWRAS